MRIDKISNIYESYKKQAASKNQAAAKVNKKDEVALSGTAKDFQTVYKLLNNTPDVREDKVNAVREQIQSGTYNVRAEEVADKILSRVDLKG